MIQQVSGRIAIFSAHDSYYDLNASESSLCGVYVADAAFGRIVLSILPARSIS